MLGTGAVLTCFIGLYGYLSPVNHAWIERLTSGPGDQSSALLTLMPLVLVAIWLARAEKASRALQRTLWVLPLLVLAAAYATLNRTVWLGFAMELIVMAVLLLPRPEFKPLLTRGRAKLLAGLIAVAIVGGVALVMMQVLEKRGNVSLETTVASDPRMQIWVAAVDTIKERPVTGLGFGRGIDRQSLNEELGNPLFWHAHNLVLETAVDTGLIGAALLLLLIGMTAHKAFRQARHEVTQPAACGTALVAIVAGMIMRNMTDTLLVRQNALLYWGVAALLLGLATVRRGRG